MKGVAFTPGRADMFLEAISSGSEDSEAAEYADITVAAANKRRKTDAKFAAAYKEAREARIETYRMEAKRRAIDGWQEPVFYQGEQIGTTRKFSDRMLEVLLRAEDPDTFGDKHVVEILTTPMTGADVAAAVAVGQLEGMAELLEQVAAVFADQAVIEAVSSPTDPDVYEMAGG